MKRISRYISISISLIIFVFLFIVSCKPKVEDKSAAEQASSFLKTSFDPDIVNIDLGKFQLKENADNQTIKDVVSRLNDKKQISHKQITDLLIDLHIKDYNKESSDPKKQEFINKYRNRRELNKDTITAFLNNIIDDLKSKKTTNKIKKKYEDYITKRIINGEILEHYLATNAFDILEDGAGRIQTYSGTSLNQILKRLLKDGASFEKDNNVIIIQANHVLPGYMKEITKNQWRLYGIETTKTGVALVDFGPTDKLYHRGEGIRVVDAQYFAILESLKFDLNKDNAVGLAMVALKKTARKYNIARLEDLELLIRHQFYRSIQYDSSDYRISEIKKSYFSFGDTGPQPQEVDEDRDNGNVTTKAFPTASYSLLDDRDDRIERSEEEKEETTKEKVSKPDITKPEVAKQEISKPEGTKSEETEPEEIDPEGLFKEYKAKCGYYTSGNISGINEYAQLFGPKLENSAVEFTSAEKEFLKKFLGDQDYSMFMKGYSGLMAYCLAAIRTQILYRYIGFYDEQYNKKAEDLRERRILYSRLIRKTPKGKRPLRYTDWSTLSNILISISSKVVRIQNNPEFIKEIISEDELIKRMLLKPFFIKRIKQVFVDVDSYLKLQNDYSNPTPETHQYYLNKVGKVGYKISTKYVEVLDKVFYKNASSDDRRIFKKTKGWHPDYAYAKYLVEDHQYTDFNNKLQEFQEMTVQDFLKKTAIAVKVLNFFKSAGKYSAITLGAIYGGRKGMAVAGAVWQFSDKYWQLKNDSSVSEGYRISKAIIAGIHGLGYGLQGGGQAILQGGATILDGIVPPLVEKGNLSFADASTAIQEGTIEGAFIYIVGKVFGPLGETSGGKEVSKDIVEAIFKNKDNPEKLRQISQFLVGLVGEDLTVEQLKSQVTQIL